MKEYLVIQTFTGSWTSLSFPADGGDVLVYAELDNGDVRIDTLPQTTARDTLDWLQTRPADYTVQEIN